MTEPRTRARFPEAAAGAGLYESFYLKACRPGGGLGVWIRYTVLKPPGAPAAGSLWCTLFDAAAPAPAAAKVTLAPDRLRRPAGGYLALGAASFEPGRVAGADPAGPTPAAWDLRFEPTAAAYDHFPRAWMYRTPVPRTKLHSPYPAVRVHATSPWATAACAWTAGRAWSATTGAASTPSAGSGCTAPASAAATTAPSWTWRPAASGSAAAPPRSSPTACSAWTACATSSAA